MFKNIIFAALLAASSVVAHSNMYKPTPRRDVDSAYQSSNENACGFDGTDIPDENNFQRGQKVPVECKSPTVGVLANGVHTFSSALRVVEQPSRWLHQDGSYQEYGGQRFCQGPAILSSQ